MIAVGWYDTAQRREHVKAIRANARGRDVSDVHLDHPSFLDALAHAIDLRTKRPVIMVGPIAEWRPPPSDGEPIDTVCWREGILRLLEDSGIAVSFIDIDKATLEVQHGGTDSQVIRRYVRATQRLESEINSRKRRVGLYGRPPFGYRVRDGVATIDPSEAKAITQVFDLVRQGLEKSEIVATMKQRFPRTSKRKPQYWGYGKLRRIISRAPLYCLGRVSEHMRDPDLAFLPAEWIDTCWEIPTTPTDKDTA